MNGNGRTPLGDAEARERIRSDHDTTLFVEAAAGTGKTTAVTERVVAMVATGTARMGGIAAITFTQKAAGELRLRIRQEIEGRLKEIDRDADAGVRNRLETALSQLEEASIGTIHAFCGEILRERPIEAGVDPGFEVLAGGEQRAFFERIFERFVRKQIEDPGPGVARLLRRSRDPWRSPVDILREAAWRLLDFRRFDAGWTRRGWKPDEAMRRLVGARDGGDPHPGQATPSGAPTLVEIERLYRAFPAESPDARPNWLRHSMGEAAALAREIRVREAADASDPEWREQALATLRMKEWGGRAPSDLPSTRQWRDRFREELHAFQQASNADLAALLREDLRGFVQDYEEAKRNAGKLDFDDLLVLTRDLLAGNAAVRAELRSRFRQILLDEYQDTDPLQTEIALLLTAEDPPGGDWSRAVPVPGRLCLVGDPKQSIYRFRRADVRRYLAVKKRLLAAGAVEVQLSTNFRSLPAICEFVNAVMKPIFRSSARTGRVVRQVDYVSLHPHRTAGSDRPALFAIAVPPERYLSRLAGPEPEAVAGFVQHLLTSKFRISDERVGDRPVKPEDICLLFRRFRNQGRLVPQRWADALRDREIPHALAAVESHVGSPEISFLRAALTAVEFPDDEVAVYATLRGPLFGFPDQELFLFRERRGRTGLAPSRAARAKREEGAPPIEREILDALAFLDLLHRKRNRQPIPSTIQELLGRNRAETGFAFWKWPDQVLANLRRLVESARVFEARGGISFRAFVEKLAAEAENPDAAASHVIDDEVAGVRIMTMHAVKGLEFPVVILCEGAFGRLPQVGRVVRPERNLHACDLGNGLVPWDVLEERDIEKAEDHAEMERLLYVAVTRARDLLAAPAAPVYPEESHLAPVAGELGKRLAAQLSGPDGPRPAPGRVGRWDPDDLWGPRRDLVDSGAGPSEAPRGDPGLWDLLRQRPGDAAAEEGRIREAEFVRERERTFESGKQPRWRVARAGALGMGTLPAGAVKVHSVPHEPDRPGGKDFGNLVHRLLEIIPLDAPAREVLRAAERAVVELAVPAELAAPAGRAVAAALRHPVMEAARTAEVRYRELPLLHREEAAAPVRERSGLEADSVLEGEEDGTAEDGEPGVAAGPAVVDGVADLVFQEQRGRAWTVVDFKTGAPEAEEEAYRVQVTLYARAVERATGEPARAVLLFV